MSLTGVIRREWRFLQGVSRTLWSVREIKPDSKVLVCDDFERAVDEFADHTAMVFEGERYTYRQLDALARPRQWRKVRLQRVSDRGHAIGIETAGVDLSQMQQGSARCTLLLGYPLQLGTGVRHGSHFLRREMGRYRSARPPGALG